MENSSDNNIINIINEDGYLESINVVFLDVEANMFLSDFDKEYYEKKVLFLTNKFIEVTKEKSPTFNMKSFYKNILHSTICFGIDLDNKNLYEALINDDFLPRGCYDLDNNKIYLRDVDSLCIYFHELYHLATADKIDDIFYFGFSHYNPYGESLPLTGINEGYTELMDHSNFNNFLNFRKLEEYAMFVVQKAIGREITDKLYSENDFLGLMREAKKIDILNELVTIINSSEQLYYKEEISESDFYYLFGSLSSIIAKNLDLSKTSTKYISNIMTVHLNNVIKFVLEGSDDAIGTNEIVKEIYDSFIHDLFERENSLKLELK